MCGEGWSRSVVSRWTDARKSGEKLAAHRQRRSTVPPSRSVKILTIRSTFSVLVIWMAWRNVWGRLE
jgi:hypothetical protein